MPHAHRARGRYKAGPPAAGVTADEGRVARALNGEDIDLNPLKLWAAIDALDTAGRRSAESIARRLGCGARTVERRRAARRREQGGAP